MIRYGDIRQAGGYRAMRELLALPQPPTSVFIANNRWRECAIPNAPFVASSSIPNS
ncbi:MAG: hypothetical protein J2P41_08830 [Blastocatellia bacterium]|nr:hypothetical protein [Blastocatellia bacterium]